MENKIKIQWQENMLFNAESMGGNLKIDAPNEGEGKGLRPKALMLTSLAGCTGMDIISLLKKMRAEVDGLEIDVTANLTDEHPKFYNKVHIEYRFYGKTFKKDKIEKAINLSVEKYCGVMEMFRQFATISNEVKYIEK